MSLESSRRATEWALRLGLGAMYGYSGYDIVLHPTSWSQFVPYWFSHAVSMVMPLTTYIKIQGVGELVFALLLLFWLSPRWLVRLVALLSTIELSGILVFFGVDLITFRDIGLLGGSVALYFINE